MVKSIIDPDYNLDMMWGHFYSEVDILTSFYSN